MSSQLISIASVESDLRPFRVWDRVSDLFVCGTGSPTFLCVGPGLRPFCVWDRVSDPVLRVEDPQPHNHRQLRELSILTS